MKLTEEQDHWNAIVHEIGHALVARKLGYGALWQVYPSRSQGSRSWEGSTALPIAVLPGDRRVIALAGAISEIIVGVIPFSFDPSDLAVVGMLRDYTFSETDAEYMAGAYSRDDALRCVSLVRELAPQIVDLAIANGGVLPRNRLSNGSEA